MKSNLIESPSKEVTESGATTGAKMRSRLAFVGVAMFLVSVLSGGASLSEIQPGWSELIKILAVALFVGSMVALALGMIGDARRRRR